MVDEVMAGLGHRPAFLVGCKSTGGLGAGLFLAIVFGGFLYLMMSALPQEIGDYSLVRFPAAAAGAACGFLIGTSLVGITVLADRRRAALREYALLHGLRILDRAPLSSATALQRRTDRQYAEPLLVGEISPGLWGQVGRCVQIEITQTSDKEKEHRFFSTFALCELEHSSVKLDRIYVLPSWSSAGAIKTGIASGIFSRDLQTNAGIAVDVLTRGWPMTEIRLESECLRERFRIFAGAECDPIWLRKLFSPSFIVWLSDSVPRAMSIEIEGTSVCVSRPGEVDALEQLDELVGIAGAVRRRLGQELG